MTTQEAIDISKSIPLKKKRLSKSSMNARRVADNVIKQVENGRKVNLSKAIREAGYSDAVATQPNKVTDQQEYKDAMATYEQKIVKLRDKTMNALLSKDLPNEKTYDLTGLLKVSDHSVALAQGKSTENIATKSQVVVFGSDDWLSLQMKAKEDKENMAR